ncbi:hypothetical protein [Haladaptatus sp. NG-WS-4]
MLILIGGFFLVVALLGFGIPVTEYQATYYAQPVEGKSPDATGHWQGVDVDELPSECRKVAYELAAGQTVSEAGYQFPSERQMQSDGRQGDDPILLVKRTNLSDSWRVGDSFFGDHLVSGEYLRVEGRYYHLWGRYSEGVFSFRHKQLLYSIALTGLVLLGIGLFKEMS